MLRMCPVSNIFSSTKVIYVTTQQLESVCFGINKKLHGPVKCPIRHPSIVGLFWKVNTIFHQIQLSLTKNWIWI